MNLPAEFEEKMKRLLGGEYGEFLKSYDSDRAMGLRVNRIKLGRGEEKRLPFTLRPVPWTEDGYYYDSAERPGRHPYHEAGVYYIQEPSAMAVAAVLEPEPGERVLDLCAAPGGKTSHAASLMAGKGFLLSNEIHPARAKILSQNVERMGLSDCVVTNESSDALARRFPGFFDKIIVDAPCSGEGMFRKDEEAAGQWSPGHVTLCAARQAEILENASAMLRPGGRMVYSTCTFSPEENEGTIARFLERHPDFRLVRVKMYPGFAPGRPEWTSGGGADGETEKTVRLWPHRLEGEGHFLALLEKAGGDTDAEGECGEAAESKAVKPAKGLNPQKGAKTPPYVKDRRLLKDFFQFCDQTLTPETAEWFAGQSTYVLFGGQLYLVPPEMPDFSGLKVLRAGLHLGEFKKNRFEPSHALALWLTPGQVNAYYETGDLREAESYLGGGVFSENACAGRVCGGAPAKGWALFVYGGFPLGWVKGAAGTLKNHYPKGLRWMNVH
ncbi:MAG TPA: RsmB/NOP family class I SAM-dependent RNA methyltransferase [Candidatus Ventrisoma faecale]|nr:RsmB/NOP family class I SAM-dependent RNA methyltransferase [Candidatus Ventrisoma faecale]